MNHKIFSQTLSLSKKTLLFFFLFFSLGWSSQSGFLTCTTDGFCYQNKFSLNPSQPSIDQNSHSPSIRQEQFIKGESGLEFEIISSYKDFYQNPDHINVVKMFRADEDPVYVPFPWPCEENEDCGFVKGEEVSGVFNPYNQEDPVYVPFPWPCEENEDCGFVKGEEVSGVFNPYNQEDPVYVPFPWPCEENKDCGFVKGEEISGVFNPYNQEDPVYVPFPWPCRLGECGHLTSLGLNH